MIPVSNPLFLGNEKKYLQEAIDAGEVSSSGSFVRRFEEAFALWSGNQYAVAVNSGTAALEAAIWSLDIREILVPDWTIISCAIASLRAGALPYFYEGQPLNGNLMRCHLFGKFHCITGFEKIVDDCAQYWKPFKVQDIGCYSLYANKIITSGEGGVLVMNRKELYDRACYYRNLCHSEERFVHRDIGYNLRMSNLQAAVALAQLEQIDNFIDIKRKNRDLYLRYLPLFENQMMFNVEVPWMYLVKTDFDAGTIIQKMRQQGVDCRRHFYPLHRQPCFMRFISFTNYDFLESDNLWDHAFYLPSGLSLTEEQIKEVCRCLTNTLNTMI